MAPHSRILAWKIPWTEKPGRLQSKGSQRVGHDWATELNWTELSLTFRSLIHFEFIFVSGVRLCSNVSILSFYMGLFSFPSTTCWRDCLFSIVYSCLLCCRLIDHKCMGLFLYSILFHRCVCFCGSTILFWLLYHCSIVWSQEAWFLQLCSSFCSFCVFLFLFVFSDKLWNIFF